MRSSEVAQPVKTAVETKKSNSESVSADTQRLLNLRKLHEKVVGAKTPEDDKPNKFRSLLKVLTRKKGSQGLDRQSAEPDAKNGDDHMEEPDNQSQMVEEPKPEEEPQVIEERQQGQELGVPDEIAIAKQVIFEITQEVKGWESLGEEEATSGLEGLSYAALLDEQLRLDRLLEFPGTYDVEGFSVARILSGVEENLKRVREIRRSFKEVSALDLRIREEALALVGATDIAELEEMERQGDFGYYDQYFLFSDAEKEIVWEVVKDYVPKDEYHQKDNINDYLVSIFQSDSIGFGDQLKIFQQIANKAQGAGAEDLYRRTRAMLAGQAKGSIEGLDAGWRKDKLVKGREEFDTSTRRELLRDAIKLAGAVDREAEGSEEIATLAKQLNVDPSALIYLLDYGSNSGQKFFRKLLTGDLEVPLVNHDELVREMIAEDLSKESLWSLGATFPPEEISASEFFRILGERLSEDPVISEVAKKKLREIQILADAPTMASGVRDFWSRYSQLISKIAEQTDWKILGRRLEAISTRGDAEAIAWEYFKLIAREKRNYEDINLPVEIPAHVPGLPENLQWGNLSREQRKRLLKRYAHDRTLDRDVVRVDDLNEIGRVIITRTVLKEVIRRSKDGQEKQRADERNRGISSTGIGELRIGDLMHGTDVGNLSAVLAGGDRAGEFLGFDQKGDVTPLGADFSQVLEVDAGGSFNYTDAESLKRLNPEGLRQIFRENPFKAIYFASIASQYGARPLEHFTSQDAKSGAYSGVTLIFDRQRPDAFLKGMEYQGHMREHHKLVFVGLPATEISGIIVNGGAEETTAKARGEIVANGFYIPIYDLEGRLIFSPEEYDQVRNSRETTR